MSGCARLRGCLLPRPPSREPCTYCPRRVGPTGQERLPHAAPRRQLRRTAPWRPGNRCTTGPGPRSREVPGARARHLDVIAAAAIEKAHAAALAKRSDDGRRGEVAGPLRDQAGDIRLRDGGDELELLTTRDREFQPIRAKTRAQLGVHRKACRPQLDGAAAGGGGSGDVEEQPVAEVAATEHSAIEELAPLAKPVARLELGIDPRQLRGRHRLPSLEEQAQPDRK